MELIDVTNQVPRYITVPPIQGKDSWWIPYPEVSDSLLSIWPSRAETRSYQHDGKPMPTKGEAQGFRLPEGGMVNYPGLRAEVSRAGERG